MNEFKLLNAETRITKIIDVEVDNGFGLHKSKAISINFFFMVKSNPKSSGIVFPKLLTGLKYPGKGTPILNANHL